MSTSASLQLESLEELNSQTLDNSPSLRYRTNIAPQNTAQAA